MPQLLERAPGAVDPASGLLRAEHFQMAYVTNDIEQACDLLSRRLGIREFAPLGGPTPDGGTMDARFAWVGTLMYEVIHATGPGSGVFMDRLAGADGFALRHHHLGFLIHERAQWDAVLANAAGKAGTCRGPATTRWSMPASSPSPASTTTSNTCCRPSLAWASSIRCREPEES
jgi:hypothetical protein